MRIGIMCLASFGGSARIATQLALGLSERNHDVHLFTRTPPFEDHHFGKGQLSLHHLVSSRETELHPARLHVEWPEEEYRRFLHILLNGIAYHGLDVLHFHYGVPYAFLAADVKKYLGWSAPLLVGTLHGTDVSNFGRDPAIAPRLATALRHLDSLTTVSRSQARLATDLFNLSTLPQVIPNFIDLSNFQAAPTGQTTDNAHARKPRIVHVSNFRPVKDTPGVAHIFAQIRKTIEAELWLIGEGPELNKVQTILQNEGLEQDVRYWGLQHNVGPILAQTDLLLMTSLAESFCLAALEAMACGVPVLATRVGGLPEVVIDEKTGYLFPVGDHQLAARMAVGLLADPAKHQAMRKAAVKQAGQFNIKKIIPRYEALYEHQLSRRVLFSVGMEAWL